MPVSALDDNRNPLLTAVSNVDDDMPVRLWADPITHGLIISGTISVDTTGLATSAKQDTGNTSLASIDTKTPSLGQALAASSVPVVLTAAQITTLTPPAAITNYALETGGNLDTIAGKDFATQTTLSAINAKLVSGTDIGDVTINNAAGASAVNIQDGGNIITVDGTIAFSNSTIAVTNAGTFVVQENGAALTALQLIDNAVSGAGFNITQFAGVNNVTGSGTATGALRVELPTNGTGVIATVGAVTAITNALPAGTNAIGKLAANSGVDIGDTDVTSVIPGTGASNLGKAEDGAHTSGDVGVFALGVRNDNLATTFGANNDYSPISTDLNGRVMVAQKAATGTLSNVSGSASSVTILAANSARIGATITNDSSALLYLKFGATASTTSYTVVLAGAASAPFSYYEVPAGYTGIIDGIWASATGNARVTEIT